MRKGLENGIGVGESIMKKTLKNATTREHVHHHYSSKPPASASSDSWAVSGSLASFVKTVSPATGKVNFCSDRAPGSSDDSSVGAMKKHSEISV